MQRRKLKVEWQFDQVPVVVDGEMPVPKRKPDFVIPSIDGNVAYWFNEMRSVSFTKDAKTGQPNYRKNAWLMDECPRTGNLMVLNPIKSSWHLQPKQVNDAYRQYVCEHYLLEP